MTKSFKADKQRKMEYKSAGRQVDRFRSEQGHKHVHQYPKAMNEHTPQHQRQMIKQLLPQPMNRIKISQPTSRDSIPNQTIDKSRSALKPATEMFSSRIVSQYMQWKTASRAGPGLFNHGNTCFLNSTIQCLLHTPALSQVLIKEPRLALNRIDSGSIMHLYQRYLHQHMFSLDSAIKITRP